MITISFVVFLLLLNISTSAEAFETTISEFDNIDIVVNNAEIMNDKFWELEVDVNLVGGQQMFS